ncbi:MAG: helix-turn-helix transcriptional regulator [Bacilli bacterium]|nr:helix-turn-helix transcriptional regulator [Bacilli bacterium]
MDYGCAIKELRERLIITQTELAELLGVTFQTVNRWENGHHVPTTKQRRALAKLFKKHGIGE